MGVGIYACPTSLVIKLKAGFYKAEIQQMQAEKPQREDNGPGQQGGKKESGSEESYLHPRWP